MMQPDDRQSHTLTAPGRTSQRLSRIPSVPWRRRNGAARTLGGSGIAGAVQPGRSEWRNWLRDRERRPALYFLASMALLYGMALLRYPGSLLSNIPWAEEGTNLFYKAYYESLWNNIWGLDTGYLTSLPRFFAVVLVKVFGVHEHFFLAIHLIGAGLVAFMASVFILSPFRGMLRSDEARFVLSFCCGSEALFGIGPYNLCFFNIAYCGAAFPLLMLCLDHERLGRKAFWFFSVFTVLLVTSKAYFIAFLPVYGLATVYGVVSRRRRMAWFAAVGTAAILLQLAVMYVNRNVAATAGTSPLAGYGRRAFLKDGLLSLLSTYLEVFLNRNLLPTDTAWVCLLYAIVPILVAGLGWALWRRSKPVFWFFLGANAVSAASLAISLLCVRWDFSEVDRCISSGRLAHLLPLRHYTFSNILITLAVAIGLVRLIRGRRAQTALAMALSLAVYNAGFFYSREGDNTKLIKFWEEPVHQQWALWDHYWQLTNDQDCFIPVKPYPWVIQRGNEYLNSDPLEEAEKQRVTEVTFDQQQRTSWQLRGLIVVKLLPSDPACSAVDGKPVRAIAFDAGNNRLAEARMLSPPGCLYTYLLFPRKLEQVARLAFVDENNQPRPVVTRIRYFGSQLPPPGGLASAGSASTRR
jgi:hypothetical protein